MPHAPASTGSLAKKTENQTLEDSGDGTKAKYRKILKETENKSSTMC